MLYQHIIRPLLFTAQPERVHEWTMNALKMAQSQASGLALLRSIAGKIPRQPLQVMGLNFDHPIGLAAGLDKQAEAVDALFALGFSHIEVGTLTPKPQAGNPKPRLFRLPEDQSLINRMGFNNDGAASAAKRLSARKSHSPIGGNIGKNKLTPNSEAAQDYVMALESLSDVVDYFTVNLSSPNTPGLRDLQHEGALRTILREVSQANTRLHRRPLTVKIAPDMSKEQVQSLCQIACEEGFQAIIATNTTIDRSGLLTSADRIAAIGAGGLSGAILAQRSTQVVEWVREVVKDSANVIGVGGVFTASDVTDKLNAGADLVQVYTGFIYRGPGMVKSLSPAWKTKG